MNILLWILQVLLAAIFAWHGWLFLAPSPEVALLMNAMLPRWFQVALGIAEILGAIGLILPSATRVLPKLTVAAAVGVMLVTICATVLHATRGETSSAITTAVLFAIAALVAHGRWKTNPITPKR